jgi:hypothetical protein
VVPITCWPTVCQYPAHVGEDSGTLRLRAVLEPRGPAGAIVLSDDQVATLGGTKAPPVLVTVNRVMVRARVARMGGENLLGFSKKLRADLGVQIGETVEIVIVLDSGARTVDVPPALAAVLDREPDAKAAFDKLAPRIRRNSCVGSSTPNAMKRNAAESSKPCRCCETAAYAVDEIGGRALLAGHSFVIRRARSLG